MYSKQLINDVICNIVELFPINAGILREERVHELIVRIVNRVNEPITQVLPFTEELRQVENTGLTREELAHEYLCQMLTNSKLVLTRPPKELAEMAITQADTLLRLLKN